MGDRDTSGAEIMIERYFRRIRAVVCTATATACMLGSGKAMADVYKCKDVVGKVTFSNLPCPDTPPPPPPAEATNYTTPNGEWHGQVQFRENVSGDQSGALQEIANLTLEVDPRGKVVGASAELGCRALGIAAPTPTKNVLNMDISLTACTKKALNQRYGGTLSLYPDQKFVTLFMQSTPSIFSGRPSVYSIKGTMRR